jgi:hypothetical protein
VLSQQLRIAEKFKKGGARGLGSSIDKRWQTLEGGRTLILPRPSYLTAILAEALSA